MELRIVEAGNGFNWGKFGVGQFTRQEWAERPQHADAVAGPEDDPALVARSLLATLGWTRRHAWVLDLQTGEGALFQMGGYAKADLDSHRIWVCPLFEPFLTWLYQHYLDHGAERSGSTWWDALPRNVDLPDAPASFYGYRRPGPPAGAAHPTSDERWTG